TDAFAVVEAQAVRVVDAGVHKRALRGFTGPAAMGEERGRVQHNGVHRRYFFSRARSSGDGGAPATRPRFPPMTNEPSSLCSAPSSFPVTHSHWGLRFLLAFT